MSVLMYLLLRMYRLIHKNSDIHTNIHKNNIKKQRPKSKCMYMYQNVN